MGKHAGINEPHFQADAIDLLTSGSGVVAFWTAVSRATGFVRVLALAAVLGPTFLGNLFQTMLLVPYVACELMAGSLIPAILAPSLVAALDRSDRAGELAIARGFLGIVLLSCAVVTALAAATSPLLLTLVTITVDDPFVRDQQIRLGQPVLLAVLPQILLFGIGGVGVAVQHAHGRFAFATAAQILENVSFIAILGAAALLFGTGHEVNQVGVASLLFLAIGSTAAVALHAAAQWWAAYRMGVRLLPGAGWRDPAVLRVIRLAVPSCGSAALNALAHFALTIASGRVPGGAVALQIGLAVFNLPIAFAARPVAAAILPILSRDFARLNLAQFYTDYWSGVHLAVFFVLPMAFLVAMMPEAIALALPFGEISNSYRMTSDILFGLSFGLLGEAVFVVALTGAYCKLDPGSLLSAMAIRLILTVGGVFIISRQPTPANCMLWLSSIYSVSVCCSAAYLHWVITRGLSDNQREHRRLFANACVAAVAVLPFVVLGRMFPLATYSLLEQVLALAAVTLLAFTTYIGLQAFRRSPEILSYFRAYSRHLSRLVRVT